FVTNVAADSRINGRFANTNVPRLKVLLVEQVCQATGGPCAYTGRDMRSAHAGMGITDAEFNALVEDLVKSLDKFQVAEPDKNELLGVLGGLKSRSSGGRSPGAASRPPAAAAPRAGDGRAAPTPLA